MPAFLRLYHVDERVTFATIDAHETLEETFGRYRLLARLGQGGMAEVFKAKSFGVEGFEKTLVIKRILPKLAQNPAFVDMFIYEAKLAVRLSHANIVQVFDLGRIDTPTPSYYMAMEYVAGIDLATLLARCRRQGLTLPPGMCLFIAAEVAKGLDHAHRRRDDNNISLGIVHRDVSPQNVLLSWEGEVKVTDFGIAKARDTVEEPASSDGLWQLKGNYPYMSPEQARGEPVDARSDLFSLGTVLYEMLTGVNPFSAPTVSETLRRVQAGEFPPVTIIREDIPPAIVAFVGRALNLSPDERFLDAARMYEELLALLYQSGHRFRPGDLSDFLTKLRGPFPGESAPPTIHLSDLPPSQPPEQTLVEGVHGVHPTGSVRPRELNDSLFPLFPNVVTQRREVTALFVSFPVPPEQELSATVWEQARKALLRYGANLVGEGDTSTLVAMFGLGEADGRDTEYAVRAALMFGRLPPGETREGAPCVGIHVGRLLETASGEFLPNELFSALVSTAQNLSRAVDGGICISALAARYVRGFFTLDPLPAAKQRIAGTLALTVGAVRAPQEDYGRFIGRRTELRRLGKAITAAAQRIVQVVTVTGEQGLGKTRLLHEVDRRLRRGALQADLWLASCAPRGKDMPLSGITAMLHVLCGVQEGESVERLSEVEPRLRALGLVEGEVRAVLAHLGAPASSTAGAGVLRTAFTRMVLRLADDRVNVFAWDNAHCLDEESIELLRACFEGIKTTRTAFLFIAQTGFRHPFEALEQAEEVVLDELSATEVEQLIAARLHVQEVPTSLLSFCARRAGGQPLFVEELLKDLVTAGEIVVQDKIVEHMHLDSERAVPRPLRSIVAGRIAQLEPTELALLQAGAVVGEPFDVSVVTELLGLPVAVAVRALGTFEERELLRPAGPSSYVFASPLLRDVILDAIPPATRKELHGQAATALESMLGPRAEEQSRRIAMHCIEAGERDRAASWFGKAAGRYLRLHQYGASAECGALALDALDLPAHPVTSILALVRTLSAAVEAVRVLPQAAELFGRLVAHVDVAGTAEERAWLRIEAASVLGTLGCFEDGLSYLGAVLDLLDPHDAWAQRARLLEAELYGGRGDFKSSLDVLQEACARGFDRDSNERALVLLAQSYAALGNRDRALGYLEKLTEDAPANDLEATTTLAKLRGLILYFLEDYNAAVEAFGEAVALARSAGLTFQLAVGLHNQAEALLAKGAFPRAYALLRQSVAACEECAAERLANHNRMLLGYLDAIKGSEEGEEQLREAISIAERSASSWDLVGGRYLLGLLLERHQRFEEARQELQRGRELARSIHNRRVEHDCTVALERFQRNPASQTAL